MFQTALTALALIAAYIEEIRVSQFLFHQGNDSDHNLEREIMESIKRTKKGSQSFFHQGNVSDKFSLKLYAIFISVTPLYLCHKQIL